MIREISRCWIWAVTCHLLQLHPPLVCLCASEWLCAKEDLMPSTFQTHNNLHVAPPVFLIWWRSCTEPMNGIDLAAVKNIMCECAWVQNHTGASANCRRPKLSKLLNANREQTFHWAHWASEPHSTACCGSPLVRYCPRDFTSASRSKVHGLLRGLWGTCSERNMRAAPGRVLPRNPPSDVIGQEAFCTCW